MTRHYLEPWAVPPAEGGENEYRCSMCQNVYEKGRPDEEALAETAVNFPGESLEPEDLTIVCNDCFNKMTAISPLPEGKSSTDLVVYGTHWTAIVDAILAARRGRT